MHKVRKTIVIKAPLDKVFSFMSNPENFLMIWPSMVEITNVTTKPDGRHEYDWTYKMAHLKFHGHSDTVEFKKNDRMVTKNAKGIPSTFIWTFAGENGGTRVTVDVEYELPLKLLDKLAEPFLVRINEREAETVLDNLRIHMETSERPGVAAGKHAH